MISRLILNIHFSNLTLTSSKHGWTGLVVGLRSPRSELQNAQKNPELIPENQLDTCLTAYVKYALFNTKPKQLTLDKAFLLPYVSLKTPHNLWFPYPWSNATDYFLATLIALESAYSR